MLAHESAELVALQRVPALRAAVQFAGGGTRELAVVYLFVIPGGLAWWDMNLEPEAPPLHVMYGPTQGTTLLVAGNTGVRAVGFYELFPAEPLWADWLRWQKASVKPSRERAWTMIADLFDLPSEMPAR